MREEQGDVVSVGQRRGQSHGAAAGGNVDLRTRSTVVENHRSPAQNVGTGSIWIADVEDAVGLGGVVKADGFARRVVGHRDGRRAAGTRGGSAVAPIGGRGPEGGGKCLVRPRPIGLGNGRAQGQTKPSHDSKKVFSLERPTQGAMRI